MKRIALYAGIATFFIHLVANPHYGFFRDELYFIICGRHPQFGYVDQPPLVPLLAAITQTFGHSLLLLRLIPAIFAAGGVSVTCLLVGAFGGGSFAQAFAALVFFFTPVLLSFGMKVGTDEVGLFTWPLIALLLVRLVQGASPRYWLVIGAIVGVTIEGKYSIIFLIPAFLIGLLVTTQRRILATSWLIAGGALALAIVLPNVLWQFHYGLPMLELLRNGQLGKNTMPSPWLYAIQELIITNIFLSIVWIVGFICLARASRFRFLAVAYVVLLSEMLVFHGKHYYPANIYPILIAAGGVVVEAWTRRGTWVRGFSIVYVVLVGCLTLPDVLPILSEANYVAFESARDKALHFSRKAIATENGREDGSLPADWADMHGWPEMAATMKRTYDTLPTDVRARTVVFAGNYGEASAIEFFAPGIPVISEHNQYWLWGPQDFLGSPMLQINGTCFKSDHLFASRKLITRLKDPYAISYESHAPIWLCDGIRKPLVSVWPGIKDYE